MRDTLLTRMRWLHKWVGFILGLLLVVIFTSGSLAVFNTEMTWWMQPELTHYHPTQLTDEALNEVGTIVWQRRAAGIDSFMTLPTPRDPIIRLLHRTGRSTFGTAYDPQTGFPIVARATFGGQLFFSLHHSLYSLPLFGSLLTEIAALGSLVAVGSGVIIQSKKLLTDLLLFRPAAPKGRGWVDAHILGCLLLLPFMVLMAYTGSVIHASRLFPMLKLQQVHHRNVTLAEKTPVEAADHAPLAPMYHQAETLLGPGSIGLILFDRDRVTFTEADSASFVLTRAHVGFSSSSGDLVETARVSQRLHGGGGVLRGLHFIRWAPLPLRWLYFLAGTFTSLSISAGLVVYLMKLRDQWSGKFGFQLAEALAASVTIGLPLAVLAYLWANRLFWFDLPNRPNKEVIVFFGVWACTLLHACLRSFTGSGRQIWREQLQVFTNFALALPVLELLTRHVSDSLIRIDVYKMIDIWVFGLGLLSLYVSKKGDLP